MSDRAPAIEAVAAVRCDSLTRRFPATSRARSAETVALDAVTLEVAQGALVGVLGPNGAGKTTLLRVICGLLAPTAGRVEVFGRDPLRDAAETRAQVGVVLGGERSVYWRLTGRENLLYAGALQGVPASAARVRARDLLGWIGLAARADDLVEGYSTGMRLRVALARALMHTPRLLVLDEPTAGLDPRAAETLRIMLRGLCREAGHTIVIATHNMPEAEELCDTVAVFDRGRLVACDQPATLVAAAADAGATRSTLEQAFLTLTASSASRRRDPV